MAFDRNELLVTLVDKFSVREYVKTVVGDHVLQDLYFAGSDLSRVNKASLPREFVIKPTHASGAAILVTDQAPPDACLPLKPKRTWMIHLVHPDAFDMDAAKVIARGWLSSSYEYEPGRFPEWAYSKVEPRLLVEEFVPTPDGQLAIDYRFWMFHGKCAFVQCDTSFAVAHYQGLLTLDWKVLPEQRRDYPNDGHLFTKPTHLPNMLQIAHKLSQNLDFVRVDFFESNIGVRFAEMTVYPGGGGFAFENPDFDRYLGTLW